MSEEKDSSESLDRNFIDALLDRAVYAPLGGLVEARKDMELAATRGRERVKMQVTNARLLGQLAVGFGSKEIGKRIRQLPLFPDDAPTPPDPKKQSSPEQSSSKKSETSPAPINHLIANYDDLSASQVVRLLGGFTPPEREEVERYERASRSRMTILNKIRQLDVGTDAAS